MTLAEAVRILGLDPVTRRAAQLVDDKWGPAVAIRIAPGEYLFVGFASS
jgi:hypothetical protein